MKYIISMIGGVSIMVLISSIGIHSASATCGSIITESGEEIEIETCDNPFEANLDFPFQAFIAGVALTEGVSYELPVEETLPILLSATEGDDIDTVTLWHHQGDNLLQVEVDEVVAESQYETYFEEVGTYTLVLNYETEIVVQHKLPGWLIKTAHAQFEDSEIFTRTFIVTAPIAEPECGFYVFEDSIELVEDCDAPFGPVQTNAGLTVTFDSTTISNGGVYPLATSTNIFMYSGAGLGAGSQVALWRHQGEDYILQSYFVTDYTFATTGTYTLVIEETDLVVTYNWLRTLADYVIPTAHAALGDRTIITFEVVEAEEPDLIDPLILEYAPILYFHPDEDYFPMNTEAFVDASALWDQSGEDTQLYDAEGLTESVFTDVVLNHDTDDYYLAFSDPNTAKSLDLDQARTTYDDLRASREATTTVYYHRMTDSTDDGREFIVLQYWFFYAMNNWQETGGRNNHEGDWESVFIFLDADTEEPEFVAYSAHLNDGDPELFNVFQYDSVRRDWNSGEVTKDDGRLVSFVSLGSHAMYPNNGDVGNHIVGDFIDKTSNVTQSETASILESFKGDNVLDYQGKWGADALLPGGDGVNGPKFLKLFTNSVVRFNEPVEWAGINNIREQVFLEPVTTVPYLEEGVQLEFTEPIPAGTEIMFAPYSEQISFGTNIDDIQMLPSFWDIESTLVNDTFTTDITFTYDESLLELYDRPESELIVYFYNPEINTWESQTSTVDTVENTVTFTTTHFSRYALGFALELEEPTIEELVDEVRELLETTDLYPRQIRFLNRNLDWILHKIEQDTKRSDRIVRKALRWFDRKIKWYTKRGYIDQDTKREIHDLTKQIRQII